MLEAFIAVFITALIFTLYTFLIIEEDLKRKSERVIYVLLIVMVAWPVSLSLLQAPSTATTNATITGVPLNCISNPNNALTANDPSVVSCGTTTQTSSQVIMTETPFPSWAFYSYMAFSLGITLLFTMFFVRYMLEYGFELFVEGLKSWNRKKSE